jgi:hypothetical protein
MMYTEEPWYELMVFVTRVGLDGAAGIVGAGGGKKLVVSTETNMHLESKWVDLSSTTGAHTPRAAGGGIIGPQQSSGLLDGFHCAVASFTSLASLVTYAL